MENKKTEKWVEIEKDGIEYKKEKKQFRTTFLIAMSVLILIELGILIYSFISPDFKKYITIILSVVIVLIVLQIIAIFFFWRAVSKPLSLSDYDAGLEKERIEMERIKKIKERDEKYGE